MTTIQAHVPDPLARQLAELAEQEQVTVDQLISIALAYQVSAWRQRDTVAGRAGRELGEIRPRDGQGPRCATAARR